MTDEALRTHRMLLKHRMLVQRGGPSLARCDLCGQNRSTDLHELVNRGRTVGNFEARRLSYVPELMALLCRQCHAHAHTPETRQKLFYAAYSRYGYERVAQAFEALQTATESHLNLVLPDPKGHSE